MSIIFLWMSIPGFWFSSSLLRSYSYNVELIDIKVSRYAKLQPVNLGAFRKKKWFSLVCPRLSFPFGTLLWKEGALSISCQ
jgi:hypothetical protein